MSDWYFDDFQVGRRFSTDAAFDVAPNGRLSNRRCIAQLDGCFPDGICLDTEGSVWVADAGGQRVVRVLEGGRNERTISTGGLDTYACMLGGDDRRTLFIRASSGTSPAMAEKSDGRIEFARVDAPGTGLP